MHHHLAVDDDVVVGEAPHRPGDFREGRGQIVAVPGPEHSLASFPGRDDAVAVVLDLEDPARAREWSFARGREHRTYRTRLDAAFPRPQFPGPRLDGGPAPPRVRDFVDREPRIDRLHRIRVEAALVHPGIRLLDEEPRVLGLARLHQRPAPVELEAAQIEEQLAGLEPRARILHRHPHALVPEDDRAGSVVALRNHALELRIVQRMVLHVDGHALVLRVGRWSPGNGPREQHAVKLQPEIPVESGGIVLLHDEEAAPRQSRAPEGLRGAGSRALGAVLGEPVGGGFVRHRSQPDARRRGRRDPRSWWPTATPAFPSPARSAIM